MPKIPMPEKKNLSEEEFLYVLDAAVLDLVSSVDPEEPGGVTLSENTLKAYIVNDFLDGYQRRFDIESLIEEIVARKFAHKYTDNFATTFYELTGELFDYLVEAQAESDTRLGKCRRFGREFFDSALEKIFQRSESEPEIENYETDVPASDRVVSRSDNAWNEPDHGGMISDEDAEQVKKLIREAIEEVPKTDLSNTDKSQAIARLEAAEKLATAPVPQWGKVQEILTPMAGIAAICASIVVILEVLAKALL